LRVIGIGDNVCDKYRHLNLMFPGGQALNVSVYARMLNCESGYMGVFGQDKVGEHIKNTLKKLAVDISRCREYPGENGYAVIDIKDGDRVFVMSNKGGVLKEHPLVLDEEDLAYIATFDLIHTSNNSHIDRELPKLSGLPNLLSYDFSVTYKDRNKLEYICPHIDFAFLSCADLPEREIIALARQMNLWGAKVIIATRGSKGAVIYNGENVKIFQPKLINPVDTLGAGDSFAAGFLVRYAADIIKRGITAGDDRYETELDKALGCASYMSAKICMMNGAFGHGCPLE